MKIVRTNETRKMQFQDLEIGDVYYNVDDGFISIKTGTSGECIYCDEEGIWSPSRDDLKDEVRLLHAELVIKE